MSSAARRSRRGTKWATIEEGAMTNVLAEITMSLDGYAAGPAPSLEQPLGAGGEALHEWATGLRSFRERHAMDGGETSADDDRLRATVDAQGAVVMGRRMFSGGSGPW